MLKLIKYLIIAILFTVSTIFLTQNDGEVIINWVGYKIYTDVTFIVLVAILLFITLSLVFNFTKLALLPITKRSNKSLMLLKKMIDDDLTNGQSIGFILADIYANRVQYKEVLIIYKALKCINSGKLLSQRLIKQLQNIERRAKKNISIVATEIIFKRLVAINENSKVIESKGKKGLSSKKVSSALLYDFTAYLLEQPSKTLLSLCILKYGNYFNETKQHCDNKNKIMYGKAVITYIKILQETELKKAIQVLNESIAYVNKTEVFNEVIERFASYKNDKAYIKLCEKYIETVFDMYSIEAWYNMYKDLEYSKIIAKAKKLDIDKNNLILLNAFVSLKCNKGFECNNYISLYPLKDENIIYKKIAIENYKNNNLTLKALELCEQLEKDS